MARDTRAQRKPQRRWLYLGARGVLQPLSEEFLYRAADDALHQACRWCGRRIGEKAHVD